MDLNYNILKLDEKLDEILHNFSGRKNIKKLKQLVDDLLSKNDSKLLDKESKNFLDGYSKDTISLLIEKKILLAIENKSLVNRKSYWLALKDRAPKISKNILTHYYDYFIDDINNKFVRYKTRTIDEINKTYDKEIKKGLGSLNENLNTALDSVSNVKLDFMENLNSNGRTLSIDGVKKGGIFLSKDSNITFGKFVNKEEFLNLINKMETTKFKINNEEISKDDLQLIVSKIKQKISINQNEKIKNQDARSITVGEENKKTGTLFFGKRGLDLPNGEYVSVEEINTAINQFINGKSELAITKEENRKEFTIVKVKNKIKKFAVAAGIAVSMLAKAISSKNNDLRSTITIEQQRNLDNNKEKAVFGNIILDEQNSTLNNEDIGNSLNQENEIPVISEMSESNINTDVENIYSVLPTNPIIQNIHPTVASNNLEQDIELNISKVEEPIVLENKVEAPIEESMVSENKVETSIEEPIVSENKVETPIEELIVSEKKKDEPIEGLEGLGSNLIDGSSKNEMENIKIDIPTFEATSVTNHVASILGLTPEQLDIVKATIRHEAGNNPEEMANVASCIKNRMNAGGGNAYQVVTAPKQFESYYDGYYKKYTGGNYYQGDAVTAMKVDSMLNSILLGTTPPTHNYQSFRSADSIDGIQLEAGGNKYR